MEPSTIIDAMKLKIHVGSKRRIGDSREFITAREEHQEIEVGRKIRLGEEPVKRH